MAVTLKRKGINAPWVKSLSCDKLSMTLQIPNCSDKETLFNRLLNDLEVGYSYWGPKGRYKKGFRYSVHPEEYYIVPNDSGDDYNLLIQCDPFDPAMSFFRMEVNPNKAFMVTVKKTLDKLLPGGYARLIEQGRITRFDATVDVEQVKIDELLFYYPQMTKTGHFLKKGAVETVYIGSQDSLKQFCIYDKAAEMHRKNQQKKVEWLKEPAPKKPITRIEARISPKGEMTLISLLSFPNPFKKLRISAIKVLSTQYEDDFVWKLFIDSCRFRTMQAALMLIPKNERAKYQGRIKDAGFVGWWKPDDVWDQLPQVVKKIANPSKTWENVPNLKKKTTT
ncbi:MAG: replication initiation factor domain-containing protein [Magnetococcus sp. THC-1_WYH]